MHTQTIRTLTAARDQADLVLYPLDIKMILARVGSGPPLTRKERAVYKKWEVKWGRAVDQIAMIKDERSPVP
jgi:hypothetical protein